MTDVYGSLSVAMNTELALYCLAISRTFFAIAFFDGQHMSLVSLYSWSYPVHWGDENNRSDPSTCLQAFFYKVERSGVRGVQQNNRM